jgi:Ca2+-binding EF-hand superfamily protein
MNDKKLKILFHDFLIINKIFFGMKRALDKKIIKHYGFHYSDKDLDYIIDSLDYGQGKLTFEEFDKIMKENKLK